jgi:hypothetical protein
MSGNSFVTATPIVLGQITESYFDSVGFFDFEDYWVFSLSETSNFELSLTGLFDDADVELYDQFGSLIDYSDNEGLDSESISRQLTSGTYYIRVYPWWGFTDYFLNVSAISVNTEESDNTLENAQPISLTSTFTFFNDFVGYSDDNDYYTFTLDNPSQFQLILSGLSSDADVELLDVNGDYVSSSSDAGTEDELIDIFLTSGTYYINVYPYSGETEYTLQVLAQPEETEIPVDNVGNTLGTATSINLNSTVSDWVGTGDENDYYLFTVNSNSVVEISLTGLQSDADIELLDSNGEFINGSFSGSNDDENIFAELTPGSYYIRVYPFSGNTSYDLSLISSVNESPTVPNEFNSRTGYGFVDASAALARAINQNPFSEVGTFGGANDWNINMINAPEVWAQNYTGQGIVVAVLDSGVDRNHPDLFSNIWTNTRETPGNGIDDDGNGYIDDVFGWNFFDNKNNTLDIHGHGTHVAGTIAGLNNGVGVTGIAYNAQIMPVKVLEDDDGDGQATGSFEGIARGIYYAVENGADVINMSLGGNSGNEALAQAVKYASDNGVIVVMAAGNEAQPSPGYPARYATEFGVAVGAVDSTNNIAEFSNLAGSDSSLVYVTHPGVSIYSALPENKYISWDGTSMAAPHVAGVVALMLEANPNLTNEQVRNILASTTTETPTVSSFIGAQSLKSSQDAKPITVFSDGSVVEPPINGGDPPSDELLTTPFTRFQNSDRPGTYLFAGPQESQSILQNFPNFIEEGTAFKVAVEANDDLIRINRFQNTDVPGTYLFAGEQESQSIRQNFPNFVEEGIAFYVYDSNASKGVDFYRFQNTQQPGTYIFVGEEEKNNILANFPQFQLEGVAFEVVA